MMPRTDDRFQNLNFSFVCLIFAGLRKSAVTISPEMLVTSPGAISLRHRRCNLYAISRWDVAAMSKSTTKVGQQSGKTKVDIKFHTGNVYL